jgi:hypothetical protein
VAAGVVVRIALRFRGNEFGRKHRQPLRIPLGIAVLDEDVLTFNVT